MNENYQQMVAQKIRAEYVEEKASELDALRALDKRVKRPINVFSIILGSIGAMVLGSGMSLVMTDIAQKIGFQADPTVAGIVIGVCGLFITLANYPLYKLLLQARKKKYAADILRLSEKLLG